MEYSNNWENLSNSSSQHTINNTYSVDNKNNNLLLFGGLFFLIIILVILVCFKFNKK